MKVTFKGGPNNYLGLVMLPLPLSMSRSCTAASSVPNYRLDMRLFIRTKVVVGQKQEEENRARWTEKKQKKAKSANGPENGAVAESAADGAVEAPGATSAAENTSQEQRPSSEAASRNPAKKNSKASGKGDKDAGGPSQLREAAIDVLNGQARACARSNSPEPSGPRCRRDRRSTQPHRAL